jgi:hypothetical protein
MRAGDGDNPRILDSFESGNLRRAREARANDADANWIS